MQLDEVLNFTKKLAKKVGGIQKEKFKENFKIRTKSTDSDLVTEVDYLCEEIIREKIEEKFPDHNILGEEGGKAEKNSDYTWIVDPLDGTNNYAIGYPVYAVSIALQFKDEIILGVIYLPERDELYYAVKDRGAFLAEKKLRISEENYLRNSTIVTGFPYDKANSHIDNLIPFKKIVKQARGVRRSGSAAFDLVCVAAGILEAVWEFKLSEWDTAAGKIMIEEAGGTVFETEINKSSLIIAGSEKVVEEIKNIILKIYK